MKRSGSTFCGSYSVTCILIAFLNIRRMEIKTSINPTTERPTPADIGILTLPPPPLLPILPPP